MKKFVSIFVFCVMLVTGAQGVFASECPLKGSINEVVGTPYKWGGTTTQGFDCSGFINYIFNQFDIKLPRTSQTQAKVGDPVSKSNLREGDLVFFNTSGKGISHAGIYIGNGKFAHFSSSKGVTISKMSEEYYDSRYVTARQVGY
ncbi:C40 family peptidase [Paenibacillus sp. MMO-177]|uniref:C40 family peptidase n=1 Tax=Paenibacillus sp. MMO-177 TaxID=3081289 RepID=UPI003015C1CA